MSDRIKKALVIIVIAGLAVFLMLDMSSSYRMSHQITGQEDRNAMLENRYQSLVGQDKAPTYVVNAQGHMDYQSARTIHKLTKFFTDMTTFRSQADYDDNRREALSMTKDPSFIGPHGFEHSMYDSQGKPEISQTGFCEQTGTVHVFEAFPGQYLVIVDYFEAYNPETFNYLDILTPSHAEFMVNGNPQYFNELKRIHGISLNNNNQDA